MSNAPVTEPPVTTYVTADGQTVSVPGQGVTTTLDTPPALDAEMRAAFESAEFRTQTTAALLSDQGVSTVDPRSDPAAAAAMAAAVGAPVLPDPTVDPATATAASVAAAAAPPEPSASDAPLPPPVSGVPAGSDASPASDPATLVPPVPGSELPPPTLAADGYDFTYFNPNTQAEETRHLSDLEIREAVGLRGWVNGLTEQQKVAIAAIEAGQARAVAAADFDRYQAWLMQQQQQPLAGNPQFDGRGGSQQPFIDYNDLDPSTAAQVQAIQQQNTLLQQQLYQQQYAEAQQAAQQAANNVDQNLAAKAQAYDQAANEYAAQRGLSMDELNSLAIAAMNAEIVPVIERRYTVTNPVNGAIVQPADSRQVVFEALDYALWQDQALYQSVEARQHAQQTGQPANPQSPGQGNQATPPGVPVPTANGTVFAPDIAAKKAQAASLATAPSSAVTPTPLDVRQLTREQTAEAMAGDIARYWQQQ